MYLSIFFKILRSINFIQVTTLRLYSLIFVLFLGFWLLISQFRYFILLLLLYFFWLLNWNMIIARNLEIVVCEVLHWICVMFNFVAGIELCLRLAENSCFSYFNFSMKRNSKRLFTSTLQVILFLIIFLNVIVLCFCEYVVICWRSIQVKGLII